MTVHLFPTHLSIKDWLKIDNNNTPARSDDNRMKKLLIEIFDDHIFASRVSYIVNIILIFLILASSLEIILNSDPDFKKYAYWFNAIDTITTLIFTVEILCRIALAGYIHKKYRGFWGKIRYIFSFYGIVDLLSILPFYVGLVIKNSYHWLKILRLFRIWRIVRYVPSFSNISGAIRRRGDEILVSLAGIILLSLTLSSLIFYAEKAKNSENYKSIMHVFVWSIGKYTDDYGSIAEEKPTTIIGQILATLNGVLGIALFALPTGLFGAAFIEQLEEKKRKEKIEHRINIIDNFFDSYSQVQQNRRRRFLTFDELQARFLYTNDEIIEAIGESDNLRFRAVKSDDQNRYNDIEIIERFDHNVCYGYRGIDLAYPRVFIINPLGAIAMGISHLTHAIADVLHYNYLSVERRMVTKNGFEVVPAYSEYFTGVENKENAPEAPIPNKLRKFIADIEKIENTCWVFIFCVSDHLKTDIDLEYGNKKGTPDFSFESSTISDEGTFRSFETALRKNLAQMTKKESNLVAHHAIGSTDLNGIGRAAHRICGANVLTIYLKSSILTSHDKRYNQVLDALIHSFKQTIGPNGDDDRDHSKGHDPNPIP